MLQHASGLSGAIKKAGGQGIQDDSTAYVKAYGNVPPGQVMTTAAGALACKYIVHAVGPFYAQGMLGEDKLLYDACYNSLAAANAVGKSISIPALSSGIFGYPVNDVAAILFQAAFDFIEKNTAAGTLNLTDICFTNFDNKTVDAFVDTSKQFASKYQAGTPLIKISAKADAYRSANSSQFAVDQSKQPHPPVGTVYPRDILNPQRASSVKPSIGGPGSGSTTSSAVSSAASSTSTSGAAASLDPAAERARLTQLASAITAAIADGQAALSKINAAIAAIDAVNK